MISYQDVRTYHAEAGKPLLIGINRDNPESPLFVSNILHEENRGNFFISSFSCDDARNIYEELRKIFEDEYGKCES